MLKKTSKKRESNRCRDALPRAVRVAKAQAEREERESTLQGFRRWRSGGRPDGLWALQKGGACRRTPLQWWRTGSTSRVGGQSARSLSLKTQSKTSSTSNPTYSKNRHIRFRIINLMHLHQQLGFKMK